MKDSNTGSPTGGTFTLTFGGQTTAAISYNAAAATVKEVLEALCAPPRDPDRASEDCEQWLAERVKDELMDREGLE